MRNPLAGAHFVTSCAQLAQLPDARAPEVAFAGRSNAGKSSALNVLAGQTQLARVSKTPGRTQMINVFEIPELGRLIDLPGYGYAKVPEALRRGWGELVSGYVETRENLRGLVVLMDVRHPLTDLDRQLLTWAAGRDRSCHILLTKADKLGFGAAKNTLLKVQTELRKLATPASAQLFSAMTKLGVIEAREVVRGWLMSFHPPLPPE